MPHDPSPKGTVTMVPFRRPGRLWKALKEPQWEAFEDECIRGIFERGGRIIDIGGGLRIDSRKGNRENKKHVKRYKHYLEKPNVQFQISDYTDTYAPDLVEDIHALSLADASIDALFCIALLEHVYDPKKAAEEIVRVLKKDGRALVYVPFLYRYHAHDRDYHDYFRYTKDGIAYLFRDCASVTMCPVRGLTETLLRFTPLHQSKLITRMTRFLDHAIPFLRKLAEKQTSGYHILIVK